MPQAVDQADPSTTRPSTSRTTNRMSEALDPTSTQTSSDAEGPADSPLRIRSDLENSKDVCPICRIEDEQIPMIECNTCDQWYHFKCQNIRRRPNEDTRWDCRQCRTQKQKRSTKSPGVQVRNPAAETHYFNPKRRPSAVI